MNENPEQEAAPAHPPAAARPVADPAAWKTVDATRSRRSDALQGPGEPYTPMPDFSKPARSRWAYFAAAAVAALLLALGAAYFSNRQPSAEQVSPAAQSVVIDAAQGDAAGN